MSIFGKNDEVRQGATGNWYTMAIIDGLIPIKPNIEIKARAYLAESQLNIVSGVATKILLDTENYDVGNDFANYKFIAPVTGYYLLSGLITYDQVVATKRYGIQLWKNGSIVDGLSAYAHSSVGEYVAPSISDIRYLTATDYIELYAYHLAGVDTVDIMGGTRYTMMAIHLLSV